SYNKIIRISEDYADRRLKDVYDFLPDDYPDDVYKNAGPYRILKSHDYKAVLVFPLYDEDRFFGIISFISKTNSAMGSQDEQSRQILSGVVTSAILYGRERQFFVEEHERLLTTLLSIGEAVIAVGANETVSLINHVASRLTGFTAEEALGRNLSEIFCTIHSQTREPLKLPTAEAFATQGRIYSAQRSILVNRDGKEYYISDSAAPIITPQKHVIGAVLVFRDETDKVKDEQEQMKVQRLEAISLLSAGIAHDFNNLLTAILGNISLAKELVPHLSEAAKILKSAEISAEKGQEITSQLLLFAKGGVSEKQASALAGIIRNTAGFLMRGCRTALEIDLDPELDGIRMSEGIFNQILSNIIINARQATQNSGSIIISAKNLLLQDNETTSLSSGPYVLIEITDTGEGIQPGDLNRIFDPYFTTKATGTGLGLTSVLAILRNHSGDIKIESQPGKGTKVSIYIPALPGDKVADQHPLCSDEEYRIIILESDPGLQKLWQRALKLPGFEVVLTSSLVDLLEWFKISAGSGNPYHCVFLSFSPLPDREFIDNIILELRKISPNLSLVICSDASSTSENLHFEETENLYILPKPFHIPELRTLVKKLKKHPTPS
ncbi:MAG: ATP-binding protein, partial [Candidatus Cloacimonetes bacterium]|nr:ATP-binding protein [Candidatus Cloacimonadota bacterium]